MEVQLSQATFQSRLTYVKDVHLAYVDIKQQSSFVLLVLHEHLGLSNYVRIMAQAICNNELSIVVPNLFGEQQQEQNDEQEDSQYLQMINQDKIAEILMEVLQYIKKTGKRIILIGFSIGAAIGLKLLEYFKDIQLAFLFYGFPPLQGVVSNQIKTATFIYVGSKDKIKYLSDSQMISNAKNIFKQNKMVEIIQLEGAKHGFMNPANQNYNQVYFDKCCVSFQSEINKLIENGVKSVDDKKQSKNQNKGKSKQAEPSNQDKDDDGCILI